MTREAVPVGVQRPALSHPSPSHLHTFPAWAISRSSVLARFSSEADTETRTQELHSQQFLWDVQGTHC